MISARTVERGALLLAIWGCTSPDRPAPPTSPLDGASSAQHAKVKPVKWESIVVATQNTCGIIEGGAAYCWGVNNYGNLGDGTTDFFSTVPRPVAGGHSFRKIAHSYTHGCGVTKRDEAWCWGFNGLGELGNGTFTDSRVPVKVEGGLFFDDIAVGTFHTCALRRDHIGTENGHAFCWGDNAAGILGNNSAMASSPLPVQVSNRVGVFDPITQQFPKLRFFSIFAGAFSTCGLSEGEILFQPSGAPGVWKCWGANFDRTFASVFSPGPNLDASYFPFGAFDQHVLGFPGHKLVPTSIRMQRFFGTVCVIGQVENLLMGAQPFCWGRNPDGQAGTGLTAPHIIQPAPVATSLKFKSISSGDSHSCAVTSQGDAYCWGANERGQLGTNNLASSFTPVAVAAGGLKFAEIMAGNRYTCALTFQGEAYCWGRNELGEIGDGTLIDRLVPTAVLSP